MSRKAIREYDGKRLLAKWLSNVTNGQFALGTKFVQVNPSTNYEELVKNNSWLQTDKLVAKPDQLIKRFDIFSQLEFTFHTDEESWV